MDAGAARVRRVARRGEGEATAVRRCCKARRMRRRCRCTTLGVKFGHGHTRNQPARVQRQRHPGQESGTGALRLDDILKLLVADGLVSPRRRRQARALAGPRARASARSHRRAEAGTQPLPPHQALDARLARRMARRQARRALSAHRSAEDRPDGGHAVDVQRLRRALPDPAGRGDAHDADRRHRRAVRARLGRRAREDPEARGEARVRQPAGHPALPGRVLQPRAVDEEGAGGVEGRGLARARLRAAGGARPARQARRQRQPRRPHRRLALAIRVRAARLRHPHRAAPRRRPRALPHRRRAAPGLRHSDAGADRDDVADQAARADGDRREAPPAGRPDQDRHARPATRSSCGSRRCRPRSARRS